MNRQQIKSMKLPKVSAVCRVLGILLMLQNMPINGMVPEDGSSHLSITRPRLYRSHSMDDFYSSKVTELFGTSRFEGKECDQAFVDAVVAAKRGDYHEAYELYKKGICGAGDSDYTHIFTALVDISIEAYCACKHLDPLTKTQFGYREIRRFNATHCPEYIVPILKKLRDQEPDKAKKVRLQKEILFWLRFAQDEEVYESEIIEQKNILEELMK